MKLFERFAAAWAVLTASDFTAVEGKPELTEENVAALEAAATRLEAVQGENETLKADNQTHAERITELEAVVEENAATVATIFDALEANNVEVPEGTDLAAIVADKINAWGKTVPAATAVVTSAADDMDDAPKGESIYSDIDARAHARFNRNKK
jgi:hypothetical protein